MWYRSFSVALTSASLKTKCTSTVDSNVWNRVPLTSEETVGLAVLLGVSAALDMPALKGNVDPWLSVQFAVWLKIESTKTVPGRNIVCQNLMPAIRCSRMAKLTKSAAMDVFAWTDSSNSKVTVIF